MNVFLVWVTVFGIWPLAEPEHFDGSLLGAIDVAMHAWAAVTLVDRIIKAGREVE